METFFKTIIPFLLLSLYKTTHITFNKRYPSNESFESTTVLFIINLKSFKLNLFINHLFNKNFKP